MMIILIVQCSTFSFFDIEDFTASDDFYFKGMELFAENLDKVWYFLGERRLTMRSCIFPLKQFKIRNQCLACMCVVGDITVTREGRVIL